MSDIPVKIALVTGATRGIGAAIAEALAAQGMRVYGTATSKEGANKITEALSSYTGCKGCILNVTDTQATEELLQEILASEGALHILINNAGITKDGLAMRMKDEDWNAVLDTNLNALFRLTRMVIRPMMKQRYGRIINITSVVGASGNSGQANYAAAKAGVAGMTRALAQELGSKNITVNCVAPGFISTDMTATLPENIQNTMLEKIPLQRFGTAQEIANVVAFLASDQASYITGEELHVNGGMYMR